MRLLDILIGSDGLNRFLLSLFGTKTGRNAPSTSKFMFRPAIWLRSLIKPEKRKVLAHIDYYRSEFLIAAAFSDDPEMKAAYSTGDPYLAFARQAGAVPLNAIKSTHKAARELFKACVLGVQYDMLSDNLVLRIGKSTPYAKELLRYHKRIYKTY